jgi:hypothetical protein
MHLAFAELAAFEFRLGNSLERFKLFAAFPAFIFIDRHISISLCVKLSRFAG